MNQILIATHGTLAQGFYDAVKFFNAQADNVHYLNGYVNSPHFEDQFLEQVEKFQGNNLIVFTDLIGGSVNQIAIKHMRAYGYHLISGCNLAVLLETVFLQEQADQELLRQMIKAGNEQLCYLNDVVQAQEEEEE